MTVFIVETTTSIKVLDRIVSWIETLVPENEEYRMINYDAPYFPALAHYHEAEGNKIIAIGGKSSKALRLIPHYKLPSPAKVDKNIKTKLTACKKWLK